MAQRTASTHRTLFVRDTFQLHILGYSAGVTSSARSSSFHAGGHTWALVYGFDDQLASISLELLSTAIDKDVPAMASLTIDDPHGQRPPAVWRSDDSNVFAAWPTAAAAMGTCRSWNLSLPDAFRGQEASYVKDDGLMIQCTIDVHVDQDSTPAAPESIVSVVPPPSISRDLRTLLLLESESEPEVNSRRGCLMRPDVTFVVEEAEIPAHKLVLAMRSSVLAAEFYGDKKKSLKVDDMSASTFRAMLRFIYTDELPIKPSNKVTFTSRACKEKYAARRRAAMARDLLVAAERYNLQKLGVMCHKILDESSHVIMPTFTVDRRRHKCQRFETACIDCISTSAGAPITVSSPNIITHLKQLLVSEEGSDLMFLVEEKEISSHQLVIAARSPVLHEAVVASATIKDGHIIVRIDDMKATVIKVVLHFIYTDELPHMDDLFLADVGNAVMVVGDMLTAACRFNLERMKAMCENLLAKSVSKENVLSMLKLARSYHCPELEDYCTEFILLPRNTKDVINSIGLA